MPTEPTTTDSPAAPPWTGANSGQRILELIREGDRLRAEVERLSWADAARQRVIDAARAFRHGNCAEAPLLDAVDAYEDALAATGQERADG